MPLLPGGEPLKVPIDPNGNLTQKTEGTDTWGYFWNAENQLTKVEKNGIEVARFAYDPLGRRVEKVAGGVTASVTYDGESILRELHGASTFRYVHAFGIDEPLSREDASGALTYYHADGMNTVAKRTNQAAVVVHEYRYDAWGNIEAGASEPGHTFTGREWDPETALYYYRARYYDPKAGGFVSEDPVDYRNGRSRFAYVGGNPSNLIDPSGLGAEAPTLPTCGNDCPPLVENAARRLCANTEKIRDIAVRWCVEKKCRERLPISCKHWSCQFGRAGFTAPDGSRIYVCAENTGGTRCPERVIAHEMQHTCRKDPPIGDDFLHILMGRMVRDAVPCL